AEELHFHAPVRRAVVTCPAAFGELERERIEQAAQQAGFAEVKLLEEPVAAALAYARHGLQVGQHILVYDLGGGTFDLAVLLREGESGFRLALEPRGLATCGGDDFDRALYDYLDERLRTRWDTSPIREFDPNRLMRCRDCKESLSYLPASMFSVYVGNRLFKEQVKRQIFDNLIQDRLEQTVRLTQDLVADVARRGQPVDTVVLIGGSARIPLVAARLAQVLPIQPHKWQHQDVAVALGAAHFAVETYEPEPPPLSPPTQAVNTVVVGKCAVNCIAFSPNGRWLASSGSVSGTIKLWDIAGGCELNILAGHTSDVLCLAFSSNGRWLASGSNDATARLWEIAKNWISSALVGDGGWVNAVAFSPDGRWLASGNAYATAKLWEVARRRESHVLAEHRYSVRSVIFSPDGRWLASGSSDKTVKVWEAASGRELRALTGHGGAVNTVAFSPDGRWLASGSSDGTIRLWQ
ncbi:MAG: Hsp70 family protein, partial [Candidatus Competibacter sp.]|nr:Hsp70 family protein [Candidatus Competibacter sp.]